jgi:hypothetical protein
MFKKAVMFFILIGFVSFWSFAQSTNYEPRLVDTWTDVDGTECVFNADGTGNLGTTRIVYGAIDNKMVVYTLDRWGDVSSTGRTFYELVFSDDDTTLLLLGSGNQYDSRILREKS